MAGLDLSIAALALRRSGQPAPPAPSATIDRSTTTVDSTARTIDRS